MPNLRCSAENCMHNSSSCCCRNDIQVAGQGAGTSDDTCCANFTENNGSAKDAVEQFASPETEVQCDAQNCTHNSACKCCADSIDVSGFGASKCDETCCSSFKPQ